MPTKRLLPLTPQQGQELARIALVHPQENVRRRAHALLLLYHSHAVVAVARQVSVARRSVYYWIERVRSHGVEGLDDHPRTERPPQVTDDYRYRLEFLLSRDPYEFHDQFPSYTPKSGWTARRLSEHLAADTGITISPGHLRQLLKDWGYHFGARHIIRVTTEFLPSFFDLQQPGLHLRFEDEVILMSWCKRRWKPRPLDPSAEEGDATVTDAKDRAPSAMTGWLWSETHPETEPASPPVEDDHTLAGDIAYLAHAVEVLRRHQAEPPAEAP